MSRKKRRQAAITALIAISPETPLTYCLSLGIIEYLSDRIEAFKNEGAILSMEPHRSPFGPSMLVTFAGTRDAGRFLLP